MKTVRSQVFPIVLSKSFLAVINGIIGGFIWFVGGAFIFQIQWKAPFSVALLTVAYSLCAAGFMALLVGWMKTEKRAETFSSIVILAIAFLGGGFFEVNTMPDFIQDHISPWMPNYWFIQSIHALQFDRGSAVWTFEVVKMLVLGGVFLWIGTYWINRNLERGDKV